LLREKKAGGGGKINPGEGKGGRLGGEGPLWEKKEFRGGGRKDSGLGGRELGKEGLKRTIDPAGKKTLGEDSRGKKGL